MVKKAFREGFTLIELTLSLIFIGILSLSIVLIISNTISSYRRGLTLEQINSLGGDLVGDMRASVQNASTDSLKGLCDVYFANDSNVKASLTACTEDDGTKFAYNIKKGTVKVDGENLTGVPLYGVFCTGTYSYIWKSGYLFSDDPKVIVDSVNKDEVKFRYSVYNTNGSGTTNKEIWDFRLLKISDPERSVCVSAVRPYSNEGARYGDNYRNDTSAELGKIINMRDGYNTLDASDIVDLIPKSENTGDLALYDLNVAKPAQSEEGNNMFYSVSFILGTVKGGINVKARGKSCAPPEDYGSAFYDYCAINKFNFAAQTNGG